jgi:hypothetical protein
VLASNIGIKIANGEFYSIIEENSIVKRRLVLTTVHDNQQSVQIDLYKSSTKTMADAVYIGSLVLENIKPKSKGEPSIELVITSDRNGNVTADSVDLDASTPRGGRQTLNVSLKSMEEDGKEYEIPDFELDNKESSSSDPYERIGDADEGEKRKGFPWLMIILVALILTALGLLAWLFFLQPKGMRETTSVQPPAVQAAQPPAQPVQPEQPAQPPAQPAQPSAPPAQPAAQPTQPAVQPAQPAQPPAQPVRPAQTAQQTPPPVIQSPARPPAQTQAHRERPPAPVASYNVPSVIPREGVPYRIRYGDTLWDISEAFYRNPWLYPRIARFNNIRNPDLIVSGTTIIVPPRN